MAQSHPTTRTTTTSDAGTAWLSNKYAKCIDEVIEAASQELRSLSLKIHENPELGLKEFKAYTWLTEYLSSKGFTIEKSGAPELKTAFIAQFGDSSSKLVIGLCSEYDALPLSKPGSTEQTTSHACAHNLIAISGLAAALGLQAVIRQFNLPAQIKLFGTPSEEQDYGKVTMLNAGDFEGVDVCMMLHGANADVIYTPFLALEKATVEFFGKASHASTTPWEGINALDAAMQVYTGIALMRQQMRPDQRVHGIIEVGGQAANIIPQYTKSLYRVRAPKDAQVQELKRRVNKIFEAAAKSTGCQVKYHWDGHLQDILTNEQLVVRFEKWMNSQGLKYASKAQQQSKLSGSTDMGNITHAIPGIHPMFNIINLEGIDAPGGLHTVEFAAAAATPVAHTATLRASKALAMTGVECILDPDFLRRVKQEFESRDD
ncbi:hypothetical protein EC957_005926 [Mortierella hygrophila]|uniref:Peptidase M20 domain-containing protein 2 n=1 Tax=Mortierella hygrophila TaxID=979708 RepID=A0A9P6FE73_9FUNG|nr:hypothetical protein EC957_005926 [Mortierella hygrophila]